MGLFFCVSCTFFLEYVQNSLEAREQYAERWLSALASSSRRFRQSVQKKRGRQALNTVLTNSTKPQEGIVTLQWPLQLDTSEGTRTGESACLTFVH